MPKPTFSVTSYTAYTEHYKTLCKHAWYAAGRPDKGPHIVEAIKEDEYGRKPEPNTLLAWRNEYLWDAWADEMDAQVEKKAEDKLVNLRLVMLSKQAAFGAEMQLKGIDHIRQYGFDSSSSAVSAIKLGIDTERTSRGISDRLIKMAKLSDEELTEETQKLLDRALESGEIIDVAEVEKEEKESETEDIDAEV